jgi:hypothetical protein
MGIRVGGLFGQLRPSGARGLLGPARGKPAQTILRGRSRRAFSFEVYPAEMVPELSDFGAVYCYARADAGRALAPDEDASSAGLQIGFIGHTDSFAERAAEHERLRHFVGHALDVVLVLRLEHESIRIDLARDLIEQHNPVLNDLLRSYQGADAG